MNPILADYYVSITELKSNYDSLASSAEEPIAVLNNNKVEAYLVPAEFYEQLLNRLEDLELSALAVSRKDEPCIEVSLDEL